MISGNYIKEHLVRKNPKDYNTWWGQNNYNDQFSPYEKTVRKCNMINFFLYGSDDLLGKKKYSSLSAKKRLSTMDNFYEFVIAGVGMGQIGKFSTYEFARRTRLFL